jgi:hypothetical protein
MALSAKGTPFGSPFAINRRKIPRQVSITTSDFADVSQSCLMGAPQLADWMKQHLAERLAAWRCVIGKQGGRGGLG